VAHAAEHGPYETAWLLADGLRGQLWHTHDSLGGLAVGQAALDAAGRAGDRRAEALAHLTLGGAHRWRLRYDLATDHNQLCAKLSAETGWLGGEATAVNKHARHDMHRPRPGCRGCRVPRTRPDPQPAAGWHQAEGTVLSNLGYLYLRTGPLDRAAECLTDALEICRKSGASTSEATILNTLGTVAHNQGRFELAERYQREALTIQTELDNDFGKANVLDDLAVLYQDMGRDDEALRHAESALELVRRSGDRTNEANYLNTLGFIRDRLGQHPEAISLHDQALSPATQARTALTETYALIGLATAHRHSGHLDHALNHAQRAITTTEKAGLHLFRRTAMTALAEVHLDRRSLDETAATRRRHWTSTGPRATGSTSRARTQYSSVSQPTQQSYLARRVADFHARQGVTTGHRGLLGGGGGRYRLGGWRRFGPRR
jgi:Tetratricopeptide repeat